MNTPKSKKTPKSEATPKSAKTPKSEATPKVPKTPKSEATPKAAKSEATPKSGKTPKSEKTPKAGKTPKSDKTPEVESVDSEMTPAVDGTPKPKKRGLKKKAGKSPKAEGSPKSEDESSEKVETNGKQKGKKRKSSDESTGEKAAKKACIFVHDVPNCSDLRSSITKELDGHKLKQIIIKKNKVLDKLYVKIIVASEDTVDEILYKTKALKINGAKLRMSRNDLNLKKKIKKLERLDTAGSPKKVTGDKKTAKKADKKIKVKKTKVAAKVEE